MPAALPHTGRRHGNPGRQAPRLKHCPNCGHDLVALEPVRYGDLSADPRGDTYWKGDLIRLSTNERIVLHTILTGKPPRSQGRDWQPGQFVDRFIIAERVDSTADSVDVTISNIRKAFRQVDPEFNHIETQHGTGYRWSAIRVHQSLARWGGGTFVLYDDGEVVWRQRIRIFLSPYETKVMKVLLDAQGSFLHWTKINQETGAETDSAARSAVNRLRNRFKEADPKSEAIHCHKGRGYKVVKPDYIPERTERQQKFAERRATGWKPVHSRDRLAA
jgi:DNA-binding response OmpR family regulator